MKQITEEWIASLAPNATAIQNARKISQKGGFVHLSRAEDDSLYMGECSGSGKSNYVTSVDFFDPEAPIFRCSCPSRQFPCKHSLALLYEMMKEKPFPVSEIPEDIIKKRAKKKTQAEKPEQTAPKKVNQAARTKKLKKQLEGLDLAQKMIDELLSAGLGTLRGNSVKEYESLAKQLGDYYLPGAQTYIKRIILEMKRLQADGSEQHYGQAVHHLTQLYALIKKARTYLNEKLESGSMEDDDNSLYEALGGVWKLEQLQQLGLCKENARLLQLSFDVYLDEARGEYVDLGYWLDIDTGEVLTTYNYRPLKALKYVREADTVFRLAQIPLLTYYPGSFHRRVRWDQAAVAPLSAENIKQAREKAHVNLAPAVKTAKTELKNTLSNGIAAQMVCFKQIGKREDGSYVLEDAAGDTILLRDIKDMQGTVNRLPMVPGVETLKDQVLFGAFFYDGQDRRICIQPYSIITQENVIRLLY